MSDLAPTPPPMASAAPTVELPLTIWFVDVPAYGLSGGGDDRFAAPSVAFVDQRSAVSYAERLDEAWLSRVRPVRLLATLPERRTVHADTVRAGHNRLSEQWETNQRWDTELAPDELRALLAGKPHTEAWPLRDPVMVVTTSLDLDQARTVARQRATELWGERETKVAARRAGWEDGPASPIGDLTEEELVELEALDAEATPRPWSDDVIVGRYRVRAPYGFRIESPDDRVADLDGLQHGPQDARWIAAFGNAVPRLLAEVRRRRAEDASEEAEAPSDPQRRRG